ncbi:hypothetical protein [Arthrobacter cheniae]|nr:hypothetical protein [Arthrobacter cheniae]
MINPAAVAQRLGSKAAVYFLATPAVAYPFDEAMPDETSVYGGSARSYPTGNAWHTNQRISMLRLAYSEAEGRDAVDLLAKDVEKMDPYAPPRTTSSTPVRANSPEIVAAEVAILLPPDGVLLKLADGMARIDTSVLAPGIGPERMFAPGQKLAGTVREGLLTITSGIHTVNEAVAHAPQGVIHPALVLNEKQIALFPGLVVRHTSAVEQGKVIAVRIELSGRADGKAWKVSPVENAEPGTVTEALSFCINAPPWISWSPNGREPAGEAELIAVAEPKVMTAELQPTPLLKVEAEPAYVADGSDLPVPVPQAATHTNIGSALELIRSTLHELDETNQRLQSEVTELRIGTERQKPSAPVPTPGAGGAALDRAQQQIALLTRERIEMAEDLTRALGDANTLAAENARLTHESERLRESILTERTRAARARQLSRDITAVGDTGPLFADRADQFRHEVYLEWVARIPASSKISMPLQAYGLDEGFIDSVESVQGIDRTKIIAVTVEVLTGIADSMPGREMHRLRTGAKGNTTFREHPIYGTAWRVSLQVNTASARRLHFWRGADGKVTFATVGVHDDMGI